MSLNKHTEEVLLEFCTYRGICYIADYAKAYINEAQNIYDSIDRTKLAFKVELRNFLCSTKDFNNVAFVHDKLTDAIIKDMNIEDEDVSKEIDT